jgi:hypothetical protein
MKGAESSRQNANGGWRKKILTGPHPVTLVPCPWRSPAGNTPVVAGIMRSPPHIRSNTFIPAPEAWPYLPAR